MIKNISFRLRYCFVSVSPRRLRHRRSAGQHGQSGRVCRPQPDEDFSRGAGEACRRTYGGDLSGLEELNAPVRDIADLGGLEHAVNLRYLNLYRNRIADLSPLSSLEKLECTNPVGQ